MVKVVGIRFKPGGPAYDFDSAGLDLAAGDDVVAETVRGQAMGKVVFPPREVEEPAEPLKPVLRKVGPEDLEKAAAMKEKEPEALAACEKLVAQHHLPMKLLSAEFSLEGECLTVYFKSENRVDFRTLLREICSSLKTRVELRQLGARDAAKMVGGFGRCGRQLCCASHLTKFEAVSMKMAKEQDMPLNPVKISGVCGRLLCCLSYENCQYREMKRALPQFGRKVRTPHGEAKVMGGNALKETIWAQLESDAVVEVPLSQVEMIGCDAPCENCHGGQAEAASPQDEAPGRPSHK